MWQPDVIIHECTDGAAPIAARVARIPAVSHGWWLIPRPGETVPGPSGLVELWRSRGLDPDPHTGIFGAVHVHPMPRSMEPDAVVPVGRLQSMRLDPPDMAEAGLPAWAAELAMTGRPVVYVSLGTHPYFSQPEFFQTVLKGLEQLHLDVVVTVGEHNDPSSMQSPRDNVHVERWLALPRVLAQSCLVVCHAGSGTLLASLAAGLPLVLLPRGADQFANAAASEHAGVARVVKPDEFTPEAIRTEVERVRTDPAYRGAAARLRAEIEAMPTPAEVVTSLEELV